MSESILAFVDEVEMYNTKGFECHHIFGSFNNFLQIILWHITENIISHKIHDEPPPPKNQKFLPQNITRIPKM